MNNAKDPEQVYQSEVCYVCNKRLYTRCAGCKIAYCDLECQYSDANDHKHYHSMEENKIVKPLALRVMESRLPDNVKNGIKGESVQKRLRRAVEKSSFSEEPLSASSSTINITREACKNGIATKSDDSKDVKQITKDIQNLHLNPSNAASLKFKTPAPIDEKIKDSQGYFEVVVTSFDESKMIYSVNLEKDVFAIISNQMIINSDYESNGIPLLNLDTLKNYNSLIMAFIDDNWMRCKVVFGAEVILENIDTGKNYNLTLGNYPLKYPLERELIVNAFAYKIQFASTANIKLGEHLEIRLINANYDGISMVELFVEKSTIKEEPQQPTENSLLTIDQMKFKKFPAGNQQFMLLDGHKIKEGKLRVALVSDQNQEICDILYDKMISYIEENQDKNNFKPGTGELTLVSYTDDEIYRAVNVGYKDGKYKLAFLDWSCVFLTVPENIWKMPKEIADIPVISKNVNVKLKSGKSWESVDFQKTVEKLENATSFEGFIELNENRKYLITIDDSLVVFKN